ncbi:MAG: hypothetical protein ABFR63_11000 [Thermodesulfobacteriota bacterium]
MMLLCTAGFDPTARHLSAPFLFLKISLTVTDDEGATDSVNTSVTVTVPDTQASSITAPAYVSVEATGVTTVVSLDAPSISDDIDPNPTVSNVAPAELPV